MKNGLTTLKRVLSLVMVFAMFLTLMPPTASAAGTTKTIYLKAGIWERDGAWFDAWVWGSSQADAWYTFADADGDGIFSIEVPADATGMKILRKNPANKNHSWDKWSETGDLTINSTKNCYEVTNWTTGKWAALTPHAYTVAGAKGLCGSDWDVSATANDMTDKGDGKYEKVFTNVPAGTYEYKVVRNHSWDEMAWGNGGSNASVKVTKAGSTVTITFDLATKQVTATVAEPIVKYDVTFSGTNVTSNGETTVEKGKDYTATLVADTGYVLPESVTVTVGGNTVTPEYDAATGALKITNVTGAVVITAVAEVAPPATKTIYLDVGGNPLWLQGGAWFDAWVWGSSQSDAWYTPVDEDADGIYTLEIPGDATGIRFYRKDPAGTAHDTNSWNKTGNLTIGTDNYFTINDWNGGAWSTKTPAAPTYTVVGNAGLCGGDWTVDATANDMALNADGKYEKVFTDVAAGAYGFKVAVNHSWYVSWGNNGNNVSVDVAVAGSTVTVTFEPATRAIDVTVTPPAAEPDNHVVTFKGTNVTSSGVSSVEDGADYTATLTPAAGYALPESVTVTVGGESVTPSYDKTTGELKIENVTGDVVITAAGVQVVTGTTVYCINSAKWDALAAHAWKDGGAGTTWPGQAMTKTTETVNGFDVYSVSFDTAYDKIIFNNNDKGAQTTNLDLQPGHYYDVKTGAWYASLDDVPALDPLATDVYLVGEFNGWSTVANEFKTTAADIAVVSLELEANTAYDFKIVRQGTWTSCATPINGSGKDLVFTSSVSGNCTLTTGLAGTYVFTYQVSTGTLAVEYAKAGHGVTFNGTNVTSNGAASVEDGADYTATLTPAEGYELPQSVTVTVGGESVTPSSYNFITGKLVITGVTGDVVITAVGAPKDDSLITVFFRNDWNWPEVFAYYWGSTTGTNPAWQGDKMTKLDTVSTPDGERDVYVAKIPADVTGLIFNGQNENNASETQQTPDITTVADGDAFYIHWDGENKVSKFTYPEGGEVGGDVNYEATFHFANNLNWGTVNLYTWNDNGTISGAWPGSAVSQDGEGLYTVTVKYTAPAGQGLNFIFNNGGDQTIDLTLPADAFDENHKAEKWIVLTTKDEMGKYNADILDNGDSIVISPIIKDNDVTFKFKAPDAASVEVRGTMLGADGWDTGVAMTKNAHGIWIVTIEDVVPGVHEYKFVVDDEWTTDPSNAWTKNGNSAFLISDPDKDVNKVTVRVHYIRSDNNYTNWNVYMWNENGSGQYDFTPGTGEALAIIEVDGRDAMSVNFKIRKSVGSNKWAAEEKQVTVNLTKILSGTIDVYYESGSSRQEFNDDVVYGNKVSSVELDYEDNSIWITTVLDVTDPATAFTLVNTKDASDTTTMTYNADKSSGTTYVYDVSGALDLVTLYQYKVKFNEDKKFPDKLYDIGVSNVYATDKFAEEFTYTGTDLGATYTSGSTKFVLWAPTAEKVEVMLYTTGSDDEIGALAMGSHPMEKGDKGVWRVNIYGDLEGDYYTYRVTVNGKTIEAIDPYARTAGVNGERGMVLDLGATDPSDGWSEISGPASYNDAIIYELHVRDFSIDDSSGVKTNWRGKFLGLTQTGTTTPGGSTTGLDYLKDLGITHLHLLPIYDYASVDETTCDGFNWGYDPQNYNVPEGSYSTNPYDGTTRVVEMKEMVDTLHENGIGVIMDVVYNHVYDAETFSFNQIVPGYFSRVNSNRSGCGNDTASEREMVRKYIVDSVIYWHDEYHIDGFRFDLVGLIDIVTINQIVADVHALRPDVIFYGEGWDMDDTNKEPGTEMAKQGNASKTPGFAYFSDNMRNLLAGDNGKTTGFVSGAADQEAALVSNYMANPWWTNNPNQVVQYASCHDNHTLVDKLIKSTGRSGLDADIIKMNNLTAAIYLTSQGIPFIHAGEELLREKLDESGNRVENSYNASDFVNHIEWSNLDSTAFDYAANAAYYKGLIEFRKAHPALSLDSAADVTSKVLNQKSAGNLVVFWIDGREVTGETHDSIYVIFNANSSAKTIELPEGDWDVCVNATKAGTTVLETVSGTVSVDGISALILVQEESTAEPTPPAPKSNVALPGSFNSWNQSSFMEFVEGSTTVVSKTLSLPAGTYTFKVKIGDDWYGNGGTIEDTTGGNAWVMDASAGDCTLKATGGAYTFTYDTTTNKLTVAYDPNGGEFGDPDEYYLCGYINNADYAMGAEPGEYKFDENGKLTVKFNADSYVVVKNGDCSEKYMTKGWLGSVTTATLHSVSAWDAAGHDKLMVPGGTEVTFTLVHNDDGTVTLSYEVNVPMVEDTSGVQDGLTLHCWNWSFAEIEANIPTIAAQGYTAIQTSPIQPLKEATTGKAVGTNWWVYYQPIDFVINSADGNALGTQKELESMIAVAHQYGIKVIVDVVTNHLANETGNNLSPEIPEYLVREDFWHDITKNTNDWNDRFEVTQYCMSGLPDLNTGNPELQQIVLGFLTDCVDAGVDGFRFDAAKSIETPDDDPEYASDFWPTVVGGAETYAKDTYGKDLYIYGELLDGTGGVALSAYTKYMAITDNSWGNSLRGNIAAGNAAMAAGYNKAVDASVLVLWAESHDTYATEDANQNSAGVSEADIIKTWALVAARADAMGLYFARPENNEQLLGVASVTGWANKEVKEINLFHNAFVGKAEVVSNENGVSYVERGTAGVILVQVADSTTSTVSVTAHAMADGQYVDQITGNTFTVADGKITGQIGDTGIAVVYNAPKPVTYKVTVSDTTDGTVKADKETATEGETVTVTVTANEGKLIDTITVTDKAGAQITVTKTADGTYTFKQPAADVTVTVTFKDQEIIEPATKHKINVSDTTDGTVKADKETATEGETVTVTVTANEGKLIDTITVTDKAGAQITVTKTADGTYTFKQPASDVTVTVTFKDQEIIEPAVEHKITLKPSTSGKITVSDDTPKTGDTVIITATPDEGVVVEKVVVKGADGAQIAVTKNADGTYSYVQPNGDVTIEATFKADYKITKGNGTSVLKNSGKDITLTANGAFGKFVGIEVDGKAVDAANYTAKSGSTVITLKADYLKTLKIGKHTITVKFTDGNAEGTFQLTLPADNTTPSTGDNSQIGLWVGVMAVSALAILILLLVKRKKKSEE